MTTILLIGYDHYANGQIEEEPSQYHLGGQSDFLLLLVIDHKNQQIHQLQFDRDTMTPIKLVATNGKDAGTRRLQLCLAHAYGRTREENNQNTIWAVEKLLGIEKADDGAEIDYYISMDISGINKLNELVGGVTVTIPNDDLLALDPTLKGGETIKLTGMQAEYFTRTRYDQPRAEVHGHVLHRREERRVLRKGRCVGGGKQRDHRHEQHDLLPGCLRHARTGCHLPVESGRRTEG